MSFAELLVEIVHFLFILLQGALHPPVKWRNLYFQELGPSPVSSCDGDSNSIVLVLRCFTIEIGSAVLEEVHLSKPQLPRRLKFLFTIGGKTGRASLQLSDQRIIVVRDFFPSAV